MPRTARAAEGGSYYHVLNRANPGLIVFAGPEDYDDFLGLLARAVLQWNARMPAFCLMPTHFHLVLRMQGSGDLGRMLQQLLSAHVVRHHRRHGSRGRVWQGRFKAFAIKDDRYALAALRYVERNAARASLVQLAQDWPWSSAYYRARDPLPRFISPLPVAAPADWLRFVNEPQSAAELAALRLSVQRERPWGDAAWVAATAERLGLESSLRRPGRPRKLPRETAPTDRTHPRPG